MLPAACPAHTKTGVPAVLKHTTDQADTRNSVMVVDDHQAYVEMLGALIDGQDDMVLAATAFDGESAITAATRHQPNIALLDIALPGCSGLHVAREMHTRWPDTAVIMLTAHPSDHHLNEAMDSGASGFLSKHVGCGQILDAIRQVAKGRKVVLRRTANGGSPDTGRIESVLDQLTPREREVLRLIAQGNSKTEIGRLLHRSPNTVDKQTQSVMDKLDLHSRVQLTRFAIREHLIEA